MIFYSCLGVGHMIFLRSFKKLKVTPDVSLDAFLLKLFLLKLYLARDLEYIGFPTITSLETLLKTIDKTAPTRYLAIEKAYPKVN